MYSHQNIMSINNNVFLKCMINVTYSYSPVVFNTTVNARILDESHISFNDIIDTLSKQIPLNNFAISYCEYDNNTETFVNCGKYPLENDILIGYNPSPIVPTYIRIKLRQIIKKENVLRMDVNEEDFENIDESKQHNFFNSKSKRAKERKIGYIIKKVYMWKTLYNGFIEEDEEGNKKRIKFTLEQAADKVGISKKSLDDYLIQLRIGKMFGFNFTEHKNDKVGVLRAFVKKHKAEYEERKGLLQL